MHNACQTRELKKISFPAKTVDFCERNGLKRQKRLFEGGLAFSKVTNAFAEATRRLFRLAPGRVVV
jgi:hypothetical protein